GKVVGFAAEHPGAAITAAIVASIAKASLGAAVSGALEAAIKGVAARGISGAGALGPAGLALTIGTAILTIESAWITQKHAEGAEQAKEQDTAIEYHLKKADAGQGDRAELEADLAAVKARIDAANSHSGSMLGRAWEVVTFQKSLTQQGQEKFDKDNMGTLQG